MDLPPSGWYPDPSGVPGLHRWWDGTTWTDHTYTEPAASTRPALADSARTDPGSQLAVMGPPTGPRTAPQPALPDDHTPNGTQVLEMGDVTWSGPGDGFPGASGAGWQDRDERRRNTLLTVGLTSGAVAACGIIALVLTSMNSSAKAPAAPPTVAATEAASASAPTTPATPTPASTAMSTVTDATSGLTYGQLGAPWASGCPASLGSTPQVFTWAAGESAVAGQLTGGQTTGGQTTWYGEACSGQLPAQYGYHSTADLSNVTNALANAFNAAYYMPLQHSYQPTQSQPVAVSGHPGWEIKFTETYTSPQPGQAWTHETGAVVVTDPENGAPPAVFYVSVPGNLHEANVDTLVSSLRLTTPAAPSPTGPAPQPGQGGDNADQGGNGDGGGLSVTS